MPVDKVLCSPVDADKGKPTMLLTLLSIEATAQALRGTNDVPKGLYLRF